MLTRWELMRMTRVMLELLLQEITKALMALPEGTLDRRIALINLFDSVKRELAHRDMTAGMWL